MEIRENDVMYRITAVPSTEWQELLDSGTHFYDYTKLTAVNMCPTWGVLRYGLHKTEIPLSMGGRNTALECGSACHDFFAALRAWTLREQSNDLIEAWTINHFGQERFDSLCTIPQDSDRVNNAQLFALDALHTSGYYDDPKDTRRTMSNMESACLVYADRYFKSDIPVYVKGDLIGIEIPFVLRIERFPYVRQNGGEGAWICDAHMYYCGRIDGIHTMGPGGALVVTENKTASRINDVWRMSFSISHQVTGYMVAAQCITDEPVNNALVMGLQIPLPRDIFEGVSFELATRTDSDRIRWCEWLFHSVDMFKQYLDRPLHAPRYSHSCNRFFSACQFIPFCALERREQQQALDNLRTDEWSPLRQIYHTEGVAE